MATTSISRRSFLTGAAGAAGAWGLWQGLARLGQDPARAPELYEYFVDNFWFEAAGLAQERLTEPLRGKHKADIVIIGRGFTGLSSAYNLSQRLPHKKIVLLEGACCGYGASGRNGGFCEAGVPGLLRYVERAGTDRGRAAFDATLYGISQIKELISRYGLQCDLEENGMLEAAMDEEQAKRLEEQRAIYRAMGLEATLVQGRELLEQVKSARYLAALEFPYGGILNPAKLARAMKRIVEASGVEVRERSLVRRVSVGKPHRIETELGEIRAPLLVLGLNAYAPKLGFFCNRVMPLCSYVIATEPLSRAQWESIGWRNRQGIADMRVLFDYQRPTADGRIVIGGSDYPYYAGDALSSGNHAPTIRLLKRSLLTTFPQLEGIGIDHAWGGTMGFTLDFVFSVGVLGGGEEPLLRSGVQWRGCGLRADRRAHNLRAGDRRPERPEQALRGKPSHFLPRSPLAPSLSPEAL